MDKTESTVRNMLTVIEAPLYDIGVLSDWGMLPGLDSIPAVAVLDRLSLLKYRNARGSHIYVTPSGEHRFTVLDDLNETTLARLACRSKRGRLEAVRAAPRLHQLQAQVPQAGWSLPFRAAQESQRRAISNGRGLR
jgi:RepB DNA-primase from phage plasmid